MSDTSSKLHASDLLLFLQRFIWMSHFYAKFNHVGVRFQLFIFHWTMKLDEDSYIPLLSVRPRGTEKRCCIRGASDVSFVACQNDALE